MDRSIGLVQAQRTDRPAVTGKQVGGVVALSLALAAIGAAGLYFMHLQRGLNDLTGGLSIGGVSALVLLPGSVLALKGLTSKEKRAQLERPDDTLLVDEFDLSQSGQGGLDSAWGVATAKSVGHHYRDIDGVQVPGDFFTDSSRAIAFFFVEDPDRPGTYIRPPQIQRISGEARVNNLAATRAIIATMRRLIDDPAKISEALHLLNQGGTVPLIEHLQPLHGDRIVAGGDGLLEADHKLMNLEGRSVFHQEMARHGVVYKVRYGQQGHFATEVQVVSKISKVGWYEIGTDGYRGGAVKFDLGLDEGEVSWGGFSKQPDLLDLSGLEGGSKWQLGMEWYQRIADTMVDDQIHEVEGLDVPGGAHRDFARDAVKRRVAGEWVANDFTTDKDADRDAAGEALIDRLREVVDDDVKVLRALRVSGQAGLVEPQEALRNAGFMFAEASGFDLPHVDRVENQRQRGLVDFAKSEHGEDFVVHTRKVMKVLKDGAFAGYVVIGVHVDFATGQATPYFSAPTADFPKLV